MDKTKVLYLNSAFTKELPTASDTIDSIYIEGYASTVDIDRSGDVVPISVWEEGLKNYLKNPIILAQHDHDDPIGRMTEHKLDQSGLWIKARISAAAEVFSLIKDGVLTAFSIGFRILDAEYNAAAEVFLITKLELIEISVVSVPANQNTLFNLSKAFDSAEEYNNFKAQFIPKGESAKGLESLTDKPSVIKKEWNMDPKELQAMLDAAAANATKAVLEAQAKEKAIADAKAVADADFDAKVNKAVAASIKVGESGAEKLLAEITTRMETEGAKSTKLLEDLQGALKEKAVEIAALQASKMTFTEGKPAMDYAEREKAYLLSKITGKSIDETKYGQSLVTKYAGSAPGAHLPGATWELEVSLNMEAEVRRKLVMAPLLRNLAMQTNVMTIPVNPEAGYATWMANSSFGTTGSTGAAQVHALKDITLNAYKVATLEYLNYEEEEDTLIVLLPIIRDGMIRRVARAMDKAYLLGAGSGADPVKGITGYDATSAVTPTNTGVATIANLRSLRKDLGAWGLDPAEVVYVVSTEVYYDLLDDTTFQTMNQVGVQASLLTGQVGSVGNSPVLVSAEFPTKAGGAATATTNIGAMAFAAGNFIAGNQRGLRFDTQQLVETQRQVLVASLRTGLTQTTTNLGQGVSVLRWS
ncbi:MAG: HK97 family phage prohead protease [Methylococcales bacterium]